MGFEYLFRVAMPSPCKGISGDRPAEQHNGRLRIIVSKKKCCTFLLKGFCVIHPQLIEGGKKNDTNKNAMGCKTTCLRKRGEIYKVSDECVQGRTSVGSVSGLQEEDGVQITSASCPILPPTLDHQCRHRCPGSWCNASSTSATAGRR